MVVQDYASEKNVYHVTKTHDPLLPKFRFCTVKKRAVRLLLGHLLLGRVLLGSLLLEY